ncbi:MAG: SgcJ/EcaC family oxidoreductase [Burkholderiales bacterium]
MSWKKTDLEPLRDEQAIRDVVATRETAWNAGDTVAYSQLLTEDADIVSATGRPARGRDALLKLFAEQHANVYAGVRTHTNVTHVRMLSPGVALADVSYELEGGKVDAIRKGLMAFILRKDAAGRWRIAAIRSVPERTS